MSNDAKIKEFRDAVDAKREKLGSKPKMAFATNASLELGGERINLNTLSNTGSCVSVVRSLLIAKKFTAEANKVLGTNEPTKFGDFTVDQWIADIKLRVKLLTWEEEKRSLAAMDKKLAALRSEDLRTSDALSDIADQLK